MSPIMGLLPGHPTESLRSRLRRDRPDPVGRTSQIHRNPRTTVRSGGLPTIDYDQSTGAPGDSHVDCVTVYFINQRTGTLAGFTTTSRGFGTVLGTRPGARLAE